MTNKPLLEHTQLPSNLLAEILYPCKTPTKVGNFQAKCAYLHKGDSYRGIVFAPDNEDWLKDIAPGTVIKTQRIRPCTSSQYPGEYMGDALPLKDQNFNRKIHHIFYEDLPDILRIAAKMIEEHNQKQPTEYNCSGTIKEDLPYRNSAQWAEIIKQTIKKTEKFQVSPFSTILLSAYLSANFEDFWLGDVELKANGYPRWQAIFSRAVCSLTKDGFILNIPGKKYHYQWNPINE
jgi:hypothetical protein